MAERHWQTGDADGDWENTNNWLEGAVPQTGDAVTIDNTDHAITSNLDQSAVTLASLRIGPGYTGRIGTATAYLQVSATALDIGENQAGGAPSYSNRIKIDVGSNQTAARVHNTARTSADDPLPTVRLLGTHASNTLDVRGGSVGVAAVEGEASTFATVAVGQPSASQAPDVTIGAGVTLTTLSVYAGRCVLRCAATTVTVEGGTLRSERSGAITTATVDGGSFVSNSTGTITTLNVNRGTADFLQANVARTVTNVNIKGGGILKIDDGWVTLTNNVEPDERCVLRCTAA